MKNGTPPTLQKVAERLAAIESQLKALQEERSRWERYRQALTAITGNGTQFLPGASKGENIAELARSALMEADRLNLDMLLKRLRELGWQGGSGDNKKDKDRIRVELRRRPDEFKRLYRGHWTLVHKTDSSEQSAG